MWINRDPGRRPANFHMIVRNDARRRWQIGEAVRLFREEGWTRTRIAERLRVDGSTIGKWLREADIPHTRGLKGITREARAE